MKRIFTIPCAFALRFAALLAVGAVPAWADAGHEHAAPNQQEMLEQMRQMHGGHTHRRARIEFTGIELLGEKRTPSQAVQIDAGHTCLV